MNIVGVDFVIEIQSISDTLNYINGLKAVIFDLDDTLYSEKDYVRSGYKAVAKTIPQVADAEKKLWESFLNRKPAIDVVLKDAGMETLKGRCLSIYRAHEPKINFYEGVDEMLKRLRNGGLKIGIITDGRPDGQRRKIKALGLESLVDKIIITDELGGPEYRKPNPRAFELMKEWLGVPYDKMVYIGDNIQKDFIAPEKLGIQSIWFKNPDGLY